MAQGAAPRARSLARRHRRWRRVRAVRVPPARCACPRPRPVAVPSRPRSLHCHGDSFGSLGAGEVAALARCALHCRRRATRLRVRLRRRRKSHRRRRRAAREPPPYVAAHAPWQRPQAMHPAPHSGSLTSASEASTATSGGSTGQRIGGDGGLGRAQPRRQLGGVVGGAGGGGERLQVGHSLRQQPQLRRGRPQTLVGCCRAAPLRHKPRRSLRLCTPCVTVSSHERPLRVGGA